MTKSGACLAAVLGRISVREKMPQTGQAALAAERPGRTEGFTPGEEELRPPAHSWDEAKTETIVALSA